MYDLKGWEKSFYNVYLHQVITIHTLSYSFVNYILMKLGKIQ